MSETPPMLSPEEAEKIVAFAKDQAGKMFQKLPLLGPVAWLMMQQPHTKHTLLSELEWRVLPPLMLDQAKLFMRNDSPLGYVSWARLSNGVAQRYRQAPHQLSFNDWNSGEEVWLVDVVTPFGGLQQIMEELRSGVLAGKDIHQLAPQPTDPSKVIAWQAVWNGPVDSKKPRDC